METKTETDYNYKGCGAPARLSTVPLLFWVFSDNLVFFFFFLSNITCSNEP